MSKVKTIKGTGNSTFIKKMNSGSARRPIERTIIKEFPERKNIPI